MEKLNHIAATVSVDGILYDLNTYKQQIFTNILNEHGLEAQPYFFELLLDGGYQQIERAYIHYNQYRPYKEELDRRFNEQFQQDLLNGNLPLNQSSILFMESLMKSPIKLGLLSSYSRKDVEQLIKHYPLSLCYDALVCGNEIFEGKPEKDMYSKIAKQMNVDPHYTIAFEATVNGVMGAYLGDMRSVYVEIHKLRVEKAQKFSHYQFPTLEKAITLI